MSGRDHVGPDLTDDSEYEISGRIMLSAIVVLFFVVILMCSLHLYARWFLLRARRRHLLTRRRQAASRAHIVFYVDQGNNPSTRGLDARVLNSLPVFTYSAETHPYSVLDCAVCLSEFEENESGRLLPKCNHSFHIECIDMWFHSHSNCPLCRTPVEEYNSAPANPGDVTLTVSEPTATGLCATCQQEGEGVGTSSFRERRKLSVEVPTRNGGEGFEGESSACESATSQSYRSPMNRMLSFKRILRRQSSSCASPSPRAVTAMESDIERGECH